MKPMPVTSRNARPAVSRAAASADAFAGVLLRRPLAARGPSYKLLLVLHDAAVTALAALAAAWAPGDAFWQGLAHGEQFMLILLCFLPVFFFSHQHLYSYHLIYARGFHLKHLAKCYGLGLLAFFLLLALASGPAFIPDAWVGYLLVAIAFGTLLLSRVLWDNVITLLMPLGLACVIIGATGMAGSPLEPLVAAYWRRVLAGLLAAGAVLAVSRYLTVHLVFNVLMRRQFRRQVLLIGSDRDAARLTDEIIRQRAPFWIAGTVSAGDVADLDSAVPKQNLGGLEDVSAILASRRIDEVIVTDDGISKPALIALLDLFTSKGIPAWFMPRLMPIIDVKLYIDNLCGIPMIRLGANRRRRLLVWSKQAFDRLSAAAGLVLTLPIFLAAAAGIKLTSPGPVFYRTRAVGKDGRLFTMYKFRSMVTNASSDLHKNYVTRLIRGEIRRDPSGRPLKITDDPRVTRVGRLLRKTSLDELPQLINVLKGDMSLVGPRPCLTYEYEVYKAWHRKRTMVLPGITGLWQVVGRSEVEFEDMILLDLYYVYNRSWGLDLSILFETLFVVLKKKGAY